MGRRLGLMVAITLVLLVVSAGPTLAAPYLQAGVDAARTGSTHDPGPVSFDVAFPLELPGRLAGTPLVLDGFVYVATFASPWREDPAEGKDTSAIWRIELATGRADTLVSFEPSRVRTSGLASDGARLFTSVGDSMRAFALADGAELWATPHPILELAATEVVCRDATVDAGAVLVACTARQVDEAAEEPGVAAQMRPFVVALDAATGTHLWTWTPRAGEAAGLDAAGALVPEEARAWAGPVSVLGETAYVSTVGAAQGSQVPSGDNNPGQHGVLWALNRTTGEPRWHYVETPDLSPIGRLHVPLFLAVTGDDPIVFASGAGRLLVFDARTGAWYPYDFRSAQDDVPLFGGEALLGMPLALHEGVLFLTTSDAVHAVELGSFSRVWSSSRPSAADAPPLDERATLLRAGGRLFVLTGGGGTSALDRYAPVLFALDANDGSFVLSSWVSGLPDEPAPRVTRHLRGYVDRPDPEPEFLRPRMAIGDDVLVYVSSDGHVRVFGRTPASIGVAPLVADAYPPVGSAVRIDASGTTPGAFGPATEHRVLWGDGSRSEWTTGVAFEHVYDVAGDHVAVVQARNPAGQTASVEVTFHVGGEPPASGILATAFAPGNQDLTFGLLGVVLTLVGASIAYVRHRRNAVVGVPLASEDRTEVYRAALERAVDDEGLLAAHHEPVLAALRTRLGLTERDHAILLAAVRHTRAPRSGIALTPGETVLGKYRIVRPLGQGGQGAAYLAQDTMMEREVVVKLLRPGHGDEAVVLREARTMGSLRHPNVVTVFDVDRVGDQVFVVMERMEGGSLRDRLGRGPLSPSELRALACDLLAALGAVHQAGTLHLDVKPANVLLTADGRAKLADFGIAQRPGLDSTLEAVQATGAASGTLAYMAPEQARGHVVTRRSDLYAAALVLYEAWTGQPYVLPGPGEGAFDVQLRVAAGRPFHGSIRAPPAVKAWFSQALHPDPAQRFEAAEAMLDALERALPAPSRSEAERP